MKHTSKLLSLLLAAALALSLAPAARAVGPVTSVADIHATPSTAGNYVRFGEAGDLSALYDSNNGLSGSLSLAEAIQRVCTLQSSEVVFDYISYVTVDASQGTLYDGYVSEGDTGSGVAGVHRYYYGTSGSNRLEDVRFVPQPTFIGDALISYYGYYHYTDNGKVVNGSYNGRIYISIDKRSSGISYTTDGDAVRFAADDFSAFSLAETGRTFRYISFTLPDASKGSLYYNYRDEAIYDAVVTSTQRYYPNTNPLLDDVYFVPDSNYAGSFQLLFSGVDVSGAPLSGSATITVTAYGPGRSSAVTADFTYNVRPGESVSISNVAEFTGLCKEELGSDYTFSYIRFMDLPPSSEGTLYYGSGTGTPVRTSDSSSYRYRPASSPSISSVRFQAHYGFEGTSVVPFRGYAAYNGNTRYFDGTLHFVVFSDGKSSPLRYMVAPGKTVYFEQNDFVTAASSEMTGSLNRIRFDALPPTSAGTLYYISGSSVTAVRTGTDYARGNLSNLHFTAGNSFAGSVTIPFTGYNYGNYTYSNGKSFSGVVTINSTQSASSAVEPIGGAVNALTYYTTGPAVPLNLYDIQNSASSALSGTPATISLTRPEGAGTLCLDFVSPIRTAAFDYRMTYPFSDVSRVSFLPEAGFSGTSRISYTVADAKGNSFRGNIYFVVTPPTTSQYFSDMGNTKWAIPAVDFFRYYGAAFGNSRTGFGPNEAMRRGDFMLLLSRAFSFPNAGTASFADVPADKYYAAAIAGARSLGIVSGSATDNFYPEDGITRQDAALYLYRALRRAAGISPGAASDLASFRDASDVSSYAVEAMGALVRLGVFDGDYGRLYPTATLTRAETMKILYYALT